MGTVVRRIYARRDPRRRFLVGAVLSTAAGRTTERFGEGRVPEKWARRSRRTARHGQAGKRLGDLRMFIVLAGVGVAFIRPSTDRWVYRGLPDLCGVAVVLGLI